MIPKLILKYAVKNIIFSNPAFLDSPTTVYIPTGPDKLLIDIPPVNKLPIVAPIWSTVAQNFCQAYFRDAPTLNFLLIFCFISIPNTLDLLPSLSSTSSGLTFTVSVLPFVCFTSISYVLSLSFTISSNWALSQVLTFLPFTASILSPAWIPAASAGLPSVTPLIIGSNEGAPQKNAITNNYTNASKKLLNTPANRIMNLWYHFLLHMNLSFGIFSVSSSSYISPAIWTKPPKGNALIE